MEGLKSNKLFFVILVSETPATLKWCLAHEVDVLGDLPSCTTLTKTYFPLAFEGVRYLLHNCDKNMSYSDLLKTHSARYIQGQLTGSN